MLYDYLFRSPCLPYSATPLNGYLSGAFAVGACLTMPDLEICIPLAVTAFAFFTIGCYCSYKANTILSDVKSTQLGDLERS